jgi:DNA-binding CsgD family transcriptional regulator
LVLAKIAGQLEKLTTATDLWSETTAALKAQGIDHVIYTSSDPDRKNVTLLATTPEIYEGVQRDLDPFLDYACLSYAPTLTGAAYLDDYDYLTEPTREFIRRAEGMGFRSGVAIPMRLVGSDRFGGFNLGTPLDRAEFERQIVPRIEDFRFFCLLVHRRLEELTAAPTGLRDILVAPPSGALTKLSPREAEVIYMMSRGITQKECARLCGISPHTVAEYLKSSYRKLGVRNRIEATRLVMESEQNAI